MWKSESERARDDDVAMVAAAYEDLLGDNESGRGDAAASDHQFRGDEGGGGAAAASDHQFYGGEGGGGAAAASDDASSDDEDDDDDGSGEEESDGELAYLQIFQDNIDLGLMRAEAERGVRQLYAGRPRKMQARLSKLHNNLAECDSREEVAFILQMRFVQTTINGIEKINEGMASTSGGPHDKIQIAVILSRRYVIHLDKWRCNQHYEDPDDFFEDAKVHLVRAKRMIASILDEHPSLSTVGPALRKLQTELDDFATSANAYEPVHTI